MIKTRLFGTASRMLAVAALATVLQAGSAQAQQLSLGTFGQGGAGDTFTFDGSSFSASTAGIFILNSPTNLPGSPNFVTGFLTLTGTVQTGATTVVGNGFTTPVTAASFSITSGPGGTGTNYLSGTFTGSINGSIGDTSASITAALPPDVLNLTSAIFTNPILAPASLAIGLSGSGTALSVTGGNLSAFSAQTSARFSAAVPEPATVALMGLGLAGIPVVRVLRRRKATV